MDLPPALLNGLNDVLGAVTGKSTPIQTLAWRDMLTTSPPNENGQGWVLGAETGSGKTLAYLLPVMHRLKSTESNQFMSGQETSTIQPRAIVLSPTHELTRQSTTVAKTLSHSLKLRMKGLSSTRWGVVDAASDTDVLLGTTGSVRKLLGLGRDGERWLGEKGETDDAEQSEGQGPKLCTDKVEWVVIDEADVLLGMSPTGKS
jgi:ATP-dependent RNA helicase MRH4